ncbi:MAG: bifunctional UDP-N-acetylglucosamine diphosphorylase/glucosamine-1-phosphate N-acetyltransferase GlmU [Acidobacteriota bacterium]
MTRPRIAVVLAAGRGTRMRSSLAKPLHQVASRPMLAWVLDAARAAGCERLLIVVGHDADAIREQFADATDITWVEQTEQLGTGHALAQAERHVDGDALLLVLSGDVPLLRPSTLDALATAADAAWGAMAVAELDDPGRYGRVLDAGGGRLDRIVEAADASPEELAVRHINAGIYALPAPSIFDHLRRLDNDNAKGEYYLTDALGAAAQEGVALVGLDDISEAFGVNTRRDLAQAAQALNRRTLDRLMDEGVTILAPERTTVEPHVRVGNDTVLHPDVNLRGDTVIGSGCEIHQGVWMQDTTLADDVLVKPYSILDHATVGEASIVGPFARLRPGTVLEEGVHIGNFVELKKTTMAPGAKANHLTYLGDASIGAATNVGAGVVTCNYDGERKHRTEIGAGAFIGSDTMLVAPVRVGDGATTGAGSTINQDVPDGALGVGRARQRNVEGWRERKKTT